MEKLMTKRFHDTTIWEEDWFVAMPRDYRDFWFYIKDKCDHAGIYRPNTVIFNKLYDCVIDKDAFLKAVNSGKQRIVALKNGRWFLPGFFVFQYGTRLNTNNRLHASVIVILNNNEVKLTSIRGLLEDTKGVKDKDKDKDKELSNIKSIKERGVKNKKFTKPTLKDVTDYCNLKGLTVEPMRFINFYDSKDWMVGKNKMSNWKAALSGWESRDKKEETKAYYL